MSHATSSVLGLRVSAAFAAGFAALFVGPIGCSDGGASSGGTGTFLLDASPGAASDSGASSVDASVPSDAAADATADDAGEGGVVTADASTDAANGDAANTDAHAGEAVGDWRAGDYPEGLTSDNYLEIDGLPGQPGPRGYKVHVPPGYDPTEPTPLVFCIHGLGQNPVLFCVNGARMDEKSDEGGFILVMPNGYENSWNGGTCCGTASSQQLDDVAFFRAMLDEVSEHLNVDHDRVYATGLSNGGYMTYRLACEAADLFAAVAPGAGAIGINSLGGGTNTASDFEVCAPSRPVPVFDVHGTADALVPYSLKAPTLELMRELDGCSATTVTAARPQSAGDTSCVSYEGCPDGVELTACTVEEGGHCWFGSPDCGTGAGDLGLIFVGANSDTLDVYDEVWEFLSRFSR